jgi:Glutathione S-transferase, N-terminal domain
MYRGESLAVEHRIAPQVTDGRPGNRCCRAQPSGKRCRATTILLIYEVRGEDVEIRPGPYCWRIRMALARKGLAFEPVPWRAVEKSRIALTGGGTVPVLVNDDSPVRRWFLRLLSAFDGLAAGQSDRSHWT